MDRLQDGLNFVRPPPSFIVGSTGDEICPVETDTDPYVAASRKSGAEVEYLRGNFGDHGFGLKRFWSAPCMEWLKRRGFGTDVTPAGAPESL